MKQNNSENKVGSFYLCKVTSVSKKHFEVITPSKETGIVFISDVSDYFVNNISEIVAIGDVLYLIFKGLTNDGKLIFSFKDKRSHFLRTPFEFIIENNNKDNFKNLFIFTNKEIKKWKK